MLAIPPETVCVCAAVRVSVKEEIADAHASTCVVGGLGMVLKMHGCGLLALDRNLAHLVEVVQVHSVLTLGVLGVENTGEVTAGFAGKAKFDAAKYVPCSACDTQKATADQAGVVQNQLRP